EPATGRPRLRAWPLSGAEGGTRTHTLLRAADFESAASTDSATSARARIIADGRGSESAVAGHRGGEDEDHADQRQFETDDAPQAADFGRGRQEGRIGLQRLAPAQEAHGRPDRDQADQ